MGRRFMVRHSEKERKELRCLVKNAVRDGPLLVRKFRRFLDSVVL